MGLHSNRLDMNLGIWYHSVRAEGKSLELYKQCIVKQSHHYKQYKQNYKDRISLQLRYPRFLQDMTIDIDLS